MLFSTSFLIAGLLSSLLAINAFQINFYSDTNCQHYLGSRGGGSDAWSVAAAGIECNEAFQHAHSFIAMVDQCQSVEVHFGGKRSMIAPECAANGFVCQYSTGVYRAHNKNDCASYQGEGITGWQMTFNKREGNCPSGYKKREALPYGTVARAAGGINATEVLEELEKRGPKDEREAQLLKRIKC